MNTTEQLRQLWTNLGLSEAALEGGSLLSRSPIDDRALAQVHVTSPSRADELLARSADAFRRWRKVPAPQRGELVLTSQGLKFAVRRVI
jgi:aldehyde dehydrogenase (NAD+)